MVTPLIAVFQPLLEIHFLISPDKMVEDGVLLKSDIEGHPSFSRESVDYRAVTTYKEEIFRIAFEKNKDSLAEHHEFNRFCNENLYWLEDYSLFISIKQYFNNLDWSKWPEEPEGQKRREGLKEWKERLRENILMRTVSSIYYSLNNGTTLKNYCESKGVRIIGDLPIYVNYDSADVWTNPEIFKLNEGKKPVFVTGVPPDYFSSTGQLWGHPVYDWTDSYRKPGIHGG